MSWKTVVGLALTAIASALLFSTLLNAQAWIASLSKSVGKVPLPLLMIWFAPIILYAGLLAGGIALFRSGVEPKQERPPPRKTTVAANSQPGVAHRTTAGTDAISAERQRFGGAMMAAVGAISMVTTGTCCLFFANDFYSHPEWRPVTILVVPFFALPLGSLVLAVAGWRKMAPYMQLSTSLMIVGGGLLTTVSILGLIGLFTQPKNIHFGWSFLAFAVLPCVAGVWLCLAGLARGRTERSR